MKKTKCVRALSLLLALVTVFGVIAVLPIGAQNAAAAEVTGSELAGILNADSYQVYSKRYTQYLAWQTDKNNAAAVEMGEIPIDPFDYVPDKTDAGAIVKVKGTDEVRHVFDGAEALVTADSGKVTWKFTVRQHNLRGNDADGNKINDTGYLYLLKIEYYPVEGSFANIERVLSIDGAVPFAEARALSFPKNWTYGYEDESKTDANGNPLVMHEYHLTEGGSPIFYGKGNTVATSRPDFYYEQDKGGNDLRYTAYQTPEWRTYYAHDVDGFTTENFAFFLEVGEHELSLSGSREELGIKSITLVPVQAEEAYVQSYADYLAAHASKPNNAVAGGTITLLEAEFPTNVSDTSVYPANDRSSAINSPSSPSSQWMNTIGAASYNTVGQWASYKFTVAESGWYNMTMRYRQNLLDGLFVSRVIKLWSSDRTSDVKYGLDDGTPTVPFREAYQTRFNYNKDWKVANIGDAENEFKFYFEKGVEYTVYYEVGLGDLASIIKEVQDSLNVINNCYLSIIKLTGASPDQYRDYGFNQIMPEVITAMLEQAAILQSVADRFVELAGSTGSQIATLEQVSILLKRMGEKESEVAKNLSNLKSNIGTLGTWLNTVKQQGLLVDYVAVQPLEAEKPRENANIFESAWFEIRAFFVSFFVDYNSMGVKEDVEIDPEESIDVWLAYGRDQSLIWRNLIDTEFTPNTNIPVQLKLVAGGTLLPSVLSGQGPDVYIGLGAADVINYAIRGAIKDVNNNEGYVNTYGYDVTLTEKGENDYTRTYYVDPAISGDIPNVVYDETKGKEYIREDGTTGTKYEVDKEKSVVFNYANTIPISLLGKTYGVPETTNFSMLFYRMDVLAELDVDVPKTWDDLLEAITKFQSNNMQVGLSYLSAMTTFVYQKGGSQWLYEDASEYDDPSQYDMAYAGAQIGYGTDIALDAFRFCARLYTDYSFPIAFDAANRFRTGEMPVIITDYCALYNTLTVFATEIRGLWSFAPLPGFQKTDANGEYIYETDANGDYVLDEDGKKVAAVNNCAVASLTATVMLHKDVSETRKDNAWRYMKWQAGADQQAAYGNQMVAIIGPSAKYATANNQALRSLSWSSTEMKSLLAQFENLAAVPNYPGSYIISRYVEFAFLAAVNEGADPVDQMATYVTTINKELYRKRQEFDMKVLADGETPPGYRIDD